jgi:plasmid segregation protein ParM
LLRPFLENSPMVMRGSFVDSPNANAVGYEMLGRTQMLRPNA